MRTETPEQRCKGPCKRTPLVHGELGRKVEVQRQNSYLRARPCSWRTNWTSRKCRLTPRVIKELDEWLLMPKGKTESGLQAQCSERSRNASLFCFRANKLE